MIRTAGWLTVVGTGHRRSARMYRGRYLSLVRDVFTGLFTVVKQQTDDIPSLSTVKKI